MISLNSSSVLMFMLSLLRPKGLLYDISEMCCDLSMICFGVSGGWVFRVCRVRKGGNMLLKTRVCDLELQAFVEPKLLSIEVLA